MGLSSGGGGGFFGGMTGGLATLQQQQQQKQWMDMLEGINQGGIGRSMRGLSTSGTTPMQIQPAQDVMVPGEFGMEWMRQPGIAQGPMQGPMPSMQGVSLRNRLMGQFRQWFPEG